MNIKLRGLLLLFLLPLAAFGGVTIKGVSGQEVEFAGVFDAIPEGLTTVVEAGSTAVVVPWGKSIWRTSS